MTMISVLHGSSVLTGKRGPRNRATTPFVLGPTDNARFDEANVELRVPSGKRGGMGAPAVKYG